MFDRQLNHFLDLFDLLIQATNHFIGGVRHLLHHHEGYQRVHLVGKDLMEGVAVVTQSHTTIWSHLYRGCTFKGEICYKAREYCVSLIKSLLIVQYI